MTGQQCDCEKGNGTSPRHFTFFFIVCALKRAAADASRSGKEKSVAVSRRGCATPLHPFVPSPEKKLAFIKKKTKNHFFFYKSSRFCDKISRNPTEISAGSLFGESFESVSSDMRCDECNFLTKVRKRKERSWRNLVLSQTRFS